MAERFARAKSFEQFDFAHEHGNSGRYRFAIFCSSLEQLDASYFRRPRTADVLTGARLVGRSGRVEPVLDDLAVQRPAADLQDRGRLFLVPVHALQDADDV